MNNNNEDGSRNTPKGSVNSQRPGILLRIDNLPPGKSWKDVRYLIGGIIHHSNVIQVKMLPLMSSMMPPFVPFQSCIVSLKSHLDPESLNELLMSLNTYQWQYHNLCAYTLPPIDVTQQFIPIPNQAPLGTATTTTNEASMSPSSLSDQTEPQTTRDTPMTPSLLYPTPIPPPGAPATPVTAAPPAPAPVPGPTAEMLSLAPGPGPMPGPGPGPGSPFGPLNGAMPPMAPPHLSFMGMGPGPPRRQYYQPNMYGSRKVSGGTSSASGRSGGRKNQKHNRSHNGNGNAPPSSSNNSSSTSTSISDRYMLSAAAAAAAATSMGNQNLNDSSHNNITNNNSRRLNQIFNERTFRKQMTGRKMSQLQILGFPPFIKLDCWEPIELENYRSLGERRVQLIETDQPEKYGRLRWTTLKDYIKLKCPRLLSLEGEESSIENNTREFYVGVYEDHEEPVGVKITSTERESPEYGLSSASIYRAIVGFNNSELYKSCLDSLRDQEYSRGYKLEVKELPPYEDEHRQQQQKSQ